MKTFWIIALTAIVTSLSALPAQSQPLKQDTIAASGGNIRIIPKFHASTQLEYRGKVIVVDPVMFGSWRKKADLILVTHSHGDHLDLPAIAKLQKPGTRIVAPVSVVETINTIKGVRAWPMSPGDSLLHRFDTGSSNQKVMTRIEAVPMYNLVRERESGQKYHPKENGWTGFIVTLGGKRLYFAGDTEVTPEMRALRNIDAAFLPMNLPYTMTPQEAAEGARAFRPAVAYPNHFRSPFDEPNNNAQEFAEALRGSGITVKILDWYPTTGIERYRAAQEQ